MSKDQQLKSILQRQPDFIEDTPLDNYFLSLQRDLFQKLNDPDDTPKQDDDDNNNNSTQDLYLELGFTDNANFVQMLLDSFKQLHSLVLQRQEHQHQTQIKDTLEDTGSGSHRDDPSLLPISLHDMKFVDALINLIIVHGIDANLPTDLRIPMESKRLSNFKQNDRRYIVPNGHIPNILTLESVCLTMYDILVVHKSVIKDDYLRMVVLKGPLYANIFLASLSLCIAEDREGRTSQDKEIRLQKLEDIQETYTLYQMYTLLTQTVTNQVAKEKLLARLTSLVVRRPQNGLISLIDFILGIRENAPVTAENLQRVNKLLTSATPRGMTRTRYLSILFTQIRDCLSYVNRPVLVSCVNGIITEFYYKNPRIVEDFLFAKIYAVMFNSPNPKPYSTKEVNDTTNILISISKNPSRDVIGSLISRGTNHYDTFMLQLWSYCLFLRLKQNLDPVDSKRTLGPYFEVILSLMKTFIIVLENYDILEAISLNLLRYEQDGWEYRIDLETQLPYIEVVTNTYTRQRLDDAIGISLGGTSTSDKVVGTSSDRGITELIQDMDKAIDLFISLLRLLGNEDAIRDLFLKVLKRWIVASSNDSKAGNTERSKLTVNGEKKDTSSVFVLLDLKLLEKLNLEFKSDIIRGVENLLQLICDLFELAEPKPRHEGTEMTDSDSDSDSDFDSDDDEEEDNNSSPKSSHMDDSDFGTKAFQILLQLLQTVLETSSEEVLIEHKAILKTIQAKLSPELQQNYPECKLLYEKIDKLQLNKNVYKQNGSSLKKEDQQAKTDRQLLDDALRNLSDPLLPIKARGLTEIRELIERKSTVITLEHVLRIHIQYLGNADPFIYMNVIKGLTALCELDPAGTLPFLVEFYRNSRNKNRLDDILKIGEVFTNYIQIENELFSGKYANILVDACLEKIRAHSKLDNRIRMSAMSILGVCLRTNARGIESRISELLDCVFGILQLETDKPSSGDINKDGSDPEVTRSKATGATGAVVVDDAVANPKDRNSFLMRRAAIHLVHDLLYSSGLSLLPENYNPRRLGTLLEYVRSRDNDYLVCEQAAQVRDILDQFANVSLS